MKNINYVKSLLHKYGNITLLEALKRENNRI